MVLFIQMFAFMYIKAAKNGQTILGYISLYNKLIFGVVANALTCPLYVTKFS